LDTIRPNLVFVVLESWVADAISYSGKIENTTPNFDAMIEEGVYFSNCYATSGTSEVGNASIFSGYSALPGVSLTLNQDKSRRVPSLNQTLKPYGYTSSYLFGGDLKYGNIGAYFLDHQFDEVKDEKHFSHIQKRGKLNVYDTDLFAAFIKELNAKQQPFLSVAFTGSTHSPWDIPEEWNSFYSGNEAGIVNTIRFADHALASFIQEAKKQPWFDNTLFIFVADHGRTCPSNGSHLTPEFFRIPLLFWGQPIQEQFRGLTIDRIVSQADLLATLLGQMQIPADANPYSRNQMCEDILPFAIYTSTLGYGGVSPECHFYFNMAKKDFFINACETAENYGLIQKTQWYLKTVWEDFKAL
jgi:phosphoglycerol transferase MdoB-like AlkP superfamily enzyme